jgi:small ligand-binding sensory domain FIST
LFHSGAPAQEFGSVESTLPRYVVSALMGCGATGLVQGVEYGLPEKVHLVGVKPIPDYNTGHDFTPFISKINRILMENAVFQTGENMTFIDDGHDAIIAVHRFDRGKKALEFIVLCNFDILNKQRISIDLNRHLPGTTIQSFEDALTGATFVPSNGRLEMTMDPCSALVLKIIS